MKLLTYYVGVQSLLGMRTYTDGVIHVASKFKAECEGMNSGDRGGFVVSTSWTDMDYIRDQVTGYSCQSEVRRLLNADDDREGRRYSVTGISVYKKPPNRWLAATVVGLLMTVIGIPLAAYLWVGSWFDDADVRVSVLPVQTGEQTV